MKEELLKENDPRCIEFYQKAFPMLNEKVQETLRVNWIKFNGKFKKK